MGGGGGQLTAWGAGKWGASTPASGWERAVWRLPGLPFSRPWEKRKVVVGANMAGGGSGAEQMGGGGGL